MALSTRVSSTSDPATPQRVTRSAPASIKALEFARSRSNRALHPELADLSYAEERPRPVVEAPPTPEPPSPAGYGLRSGKKGGLRAKKVTKRRKRKGPVYNGPGYSTQFLKENRKGEKDCAICAETKELGDFPSEKALKECEHEASACRACVTRHTLTTLEKNGMWNRVTCIECPNNIGKDGIRLLVWREDYEKLEQIADQRAEESHPRYRWCLSTDCDAGQIHRSYVNPVVICRNCGAKSCFNHKIKWHEGYTCLRYDDSHPHAKSARTSEERVKAMSKKCPGKGCNYYVEKTDGCDHMYCSKCGHNWFWGLVKYEETGKIFDNQRRLG